VSSDGTIKVAGKCLDVAAAATNDGAKVQLYDCNGTAAQKWYFTPAFDIVNPNADKCLDLTGNSTADFTKVQLWSCTGGSNQKWAAPAGLPSSAPTSSPTPTPSPSPTAPQPAPGTIRVAPYVDMGEWPTPDITKLSAATGLKNFTLAFVTSAGCKASWFNAYDPRQAWYKDKIDAIRAAGGDVKISFGGATGIELAQACGDVTSLYNEYNAVVNAYGLKYADFDIEGAAVADPTSVARRSQALAKLQQAHPDLKISFTLPAEPEGLDTHGVDLVKSARDAGVKIDMVNIMAMDYYRSGLDDGNAALQAATSLFNQLKSLYPTFTDAQLWRMVGVTPMLGQNDDNSIYNQDDARQLVSFAQTKHLGMLAFWEEGRDANACNGSLAVCTNIPQSPYEFSKIFAAYTG
jgi:hypothetical protein